MSRSNWGMRTHGTYASAYVAKDARRATGYCAPNAKAAAARAVGYRDIARSTAIAKGTTCADAKKAAKKLAVSKAATCPRYGYSYQHPGAIIETRGTKSRIVGHRKNGAAVIREIDRLTRKNCPKGVVPTAAEKRIR